MTTAPERIELPKEEMRKEEQISPQPRVRARGHLSLVDWQDTAPMPTPMPAAAPKSAGPIRRSVLDRLYENSIIALLVVTVIAVVASLAHL